jgi:threonine/homoserine/homoserine lactone efflux protein
VAQLDAAHVALILVFVVSTTGTPGPNNMLIMASGATFGFRRSLPGIAGINVGFPLMVVAVGLALAGPLREQPVILEVLRPLAVIYLLWLAWSVATSPPPSRAQAKSPPGFWRLFGFQPVNPKSWVMVLGALLAYVRPGADVSDVWLIAVLFLVGGTPCTALWCLLGTGAGRILRTDRSVRAFNVTMGLLLAASAIGVLLEPLT